MTFHDFYGQLGMQKIEKIAILVRLDSRPAGQVK
jgi:hypothetical protein